MSNNIESRSFPASPARRRTLRVAIAGSLTLALAGVVGPTPIAATPAQAATVTRRGPSNTGVPAGTVLRPSGSVVVTTDGAVIDRLDVNGCIDVKANRVIIRRTRIRCGRPTTAIRQWSGKVGLLVEDTEIDGKGLVSAAVGFSDYTLRRVNVHNCKDGPRLASRTVIESSWVHDMLRTATSHNDTIQTTGGTGIVIRGNTLDVYKTSTRDFMNAALMMGSETAGSLSNVLVEDNFLNGGNYTVNIRPDTNASNIVFRRNRFGRNFRYGPVARGRHPGVSFDRSNVWDSTGVPLL